MSKKDVLKCLYWNILHITIGFFLFCFIDSMKVSTEYKLIIFMAITLPVVVIRLWLGDKLFKEKITLTEKIMSCGLDKNMDHCFAVCTIGYGCKDYSYCMALWMMHKPFGYIKDFG